ncbi:hypothetical protein BBBOND_0310240 [Babesia bigemina]|uniref:Uncharacterized protein n=1 Tax=Babesia bigemina TaxID=5866 RepID=A0A061D8T0_BABBI|nr:hypothetical protein BBBOND_0310240 [Babesia bigemina]CDR97121.1 hypothetical protein BBBOND_0310240 [Babesia bigemina]|eukprot:XP_012769307.1 hypothetical protein BBBOND_0310240 [Babesia bigemina]
MAWSLTSAKHGNVRNNVKAKKRHVNVHVVNRNVEINKLTPAKPPLHALSLLQAASQAQLSDPPTEESLTGVPGTEASTPFSPDPQVIAAVVVALIVAIILLDLCIFRFPVGRNIRDFLVRKIPFCIAFYS